MWLLDVLRFSGASARYFSEKPLFEVATGQHALTPGTYREVKDGSQIDFRLHGDHYHVSGDATPETVALIPLGETPTRYIFQQSHGLGTANYGALQLMGESGFRLFSPESARREAFRFAKKRAARIDQHGCCFSDQADLFTAIMLLSFDTPEACWNLYRPASGE